MFQKMLIIKKGLLWNFKPVCGINFNVSFITFPLQAYSMYLTYVYIFIRWSFTVRTSCLLTVPFSNKIYITRHNLLQSQNKQIWIFLRAICYKILLRDNVDISGFVFITQADQSTTINIKRNTQRLEIFIFHPFYLW